MLPIITPAIMTEVGGGTLLPAIQLGHFGEGLYRTVVALATPAQEVRVGTLPKHHFKGVGFWITLFTSLGAMSFFWWISRPDLRHPYRRIQRGEYWGTGQGGFGGNWAGSAVGRAEKVISRQRYSNPKGATSWAKDRTRRKRRKRNRLRRWQRKKLRREKRVNNPWAGAITEWCQLCVLFTAAGGRPASRYR